MGGSAARSDSGPRLSLSVIARNEALHLPEFLDSAFGLADEVVVLDTGSTDDTMAIARDRGCIVHRFPWCDDFAAARNAALEYCSGAWILSLDADERIAASDQAALRALAGEAPGCGYRFITRNYTNDPGVSGYVPVPEGDAQAAGFPGWFPSGKVRLFPNRPGIAFEGAVHELVNASLDRQGIRIEDSMIPVHHYPLMHRTPAAQRAKQRQYLALGRKKVAANPRDAKAHYELGDQLVDLGEYAEALQAYTAAVRLEPDNAVWLKGLGAALLLLGKLPQAVQALGLCVRLDPGCEEAWRNLGIAYVRQEDWEAARAAFERALTLAPDHLESHRYLAIARHACGDTAGALDLLKRLLQRCPHHAEGGEFYLRLMETSGQGASGAAWLAGLRDSGR